MKNKNKTIKRKTRRNKKPVNVMRGTHKRFPFLDSFRESAKGFGHSRGVSV